jgi:glycosyltransferase involved in cell wall biosynthesis
MPYIAEEEMGERLPLVCIGLPVFNGAAFVGAALDSILAQSFTDFEVIVSDNCSTDATSVIVGNFMNRDSRIRYVQNERNIGANQNFNRVFGHSRSPFFKWATHDDLLAPDWLERCVSLMRADPSVVVAHTASRMVDEDGYPLKVALDGAVIDRYGRKLLPMEPLRLAESSDPAKRYRDVLRRMSWYLPCLGLIRSETLKRTRMLQPFYGGDAALLAELALLGRFSQHPDPLYIKRCHSGITVNLSSRERTRQAVAETRCSLPGLEHRLAYLRALTVAKLSIADYASCLISCARASLRNRLFYKLLPRGVRGLPVIGGFFAELPGRSG